MADEVRFAPEEVLRNAEADPGMDMLREGVRVLAEAIRVLEVKQHLGSGAMSARRNGADSATAPGRAAGTRGWARLTWGR